MLVWGGKTRGPDSAASGQIAPQISRSLHTVHARFVLCDGKTEHYGGMYESRGATALSRHLICPGRVVGRRALKPNLEE